MQDTTQDGLSHDAAPLPAVAALLRPRAIALVGVSPKGGAGARILQSNARFGFAVPAWPVNPNHREIAGHRCYASFKELPAIPDCVVVSVPSEAVLDVVGEAAAAGIRGAFVISEGFADAATDAGRALQERLVARARAAGMALAGPNCMGVASLHYGFAATMADLPAQAVSGGISLISQSGGLLNSFAELSANRGIGVNYLVSSGNEAGLEMADYIAFLADDPATKVIACIMVPSTDAVSGPRSRPPPAESPWSCSSSAAARSGSARRLPIPARWPEGTKRSRRCFARTAWRWWSPSTPWWRPPRCLISRRCREGIGSC
jgi:predicted CoA-binding protein